MKTSIETLSGTRHWTDEELEAKRQIADSIADKVIEQMMKDGDKTIFNKLFEVMKKNSDVVPSHFPDYIKEYFSLRRELPEWVDYDKIAIGQSFFLERGSEILMMLFCKSLPLCYTCKNGVQVMYRTGRFVEKDDDFEVFSKRVADTLQFVVDTMSPKGLTKDGAGIVTTQKVRLIHSMVRYYIKKGDWNQEILGEPVNQEDLVGTLMSFGPIVLEGFRKLEMDITEKEADSYMHCWKIVGHILGIDNDLLVDSHKEGLELGEKIFKKQFGYSSEGEELINSLISFMEYVTPGDRFQRVPLVLVRFLLGEEISDEMKLPHSKAITDVFFEKFVGVMFRTKNTFVTKVLLTRKLYSRLNSVFIKSVLYYYNRSEKSSLILPTPLVDSLQIEDKL